MNFLAVALNNLAVSLNAGGRAADASASWRRAAAQYEAMTGVPSSAAHLLKVGVEGADREEVLPALLAAGCNLYGRVFPGTFIDIGVPYDFLRAQHILTLTERVS